MSKQKKKSDIDISGLVLQAMTDLIVGLILLIIDKLLN